MTVTGHEALNDMTVNYDEVITLGDETFQLRSVVFVERSKTMKNLITGCTAGIVVPIDLEKGVFRSSYMVYDPQGAGDLVDSGSSYTEDAPVMEIPGTGTYASLPGVESFYERASTRGTVFMYVRST
jgi:hypothetical protein